MSIVLWHTVMSVDGFIARPDDRMEWIFELDFGDGSTLSDIADSTGALVVGRRTMDVEDRDQPGFYGGAFRGPFFVLRHDPPTAPPVVKGVTGQYLNTPIEQAIATARDAAGDKDVGLLGAGVARECLRAGLLDEILVHVAPVMLGEGIRFYDEVGRAPVRLRPLATDRAGDVTALRFAVTRD